MWRGLVLICHVRHNGSDVRCPMLDFAVYNLSTGRFGLINRTLYRTGSKLSICHGYEFVANSTEMERLGAFIGIGGHRTSTSRHNLSGTDVRYISLSPLAQKLRRSVSSAIVIKYLKLHRSHGLHQKGYPLCGRSSTPPCF